MLNTHRRCFCAYCRAERNIYRKRHVSIVDVLLSFTASVLAGYIIWQDFDPRTLLFFAFGLGFAEIFIVVRWRLSIPCPHCGFDPVVYKKSPALAAERVNAFLLIRRQDPMSAFAKVTQPVRIVKSDNSRAV